MSFTRNSVLCAFLTAVYLTFAKADFQVSRRVEGSLGESVTLNCRLEGYSRWYVISWIRRESDGTEDTIVRLPADSKIPEWARKDLKWRIRTKITIETELTEFNLVFNELSCEDRGLYVCKYVGQETQQKVLQLSIKEEAQRPSIHYNYLVIDMNTSFVVDCRAKVGYPPKRLTWLYRSKGPEGQFQVIPNNRPMRNTGASVCELSVVQPLEIFANKNSSGMIYRCAYEGEYNTRGMYDEVSVQLPAVLLKPATVTHDCMKTGSCPMEARDEKYNGNSICVRTNLYLLFVSSVLLTIL